MWTNNKLLLTAGLAAASLLVLVVKRAFKGGNSVVFLVQDRRLLAYVPRLEAVLGPVHVIERVQGAGVSQPPLGQFDYARLAQADGVGVARYAGNVLYTRSVTSTQTILQTCGGLLAVTDEQVAGRGRTGDWVSNYGCLMFTYKFTCELKYALPVQTLIPLAMVLAITQVLSQAQGSDYSTSHVRVKWPNDIYLGKAKIGGILVDSETSGALIVMNIGVGVNVDNDHPTTCLNSVTKGIFTRELLLIHYLNAFEDLFVQLKTQGPAGLQTLYEERWYHLNTPATHLPSSQAITLTHVDLFQGLVALFPDGQSRLICNRDEIKFLP